MHEMAISGISTTGTLNLHWAFALIDGLAAAGVRQAVISPGSRSTPLVLACERHPHISTHIRIDERCAGFFALGLARGKDEPVIIIATSGSAPTHWFPAVVEAAQSNVPLILLSADRPPALRGWGANQTIDQAHLFGSRVRAFHDPGPPVAGSDALAFIRALGIRAAHEAGGRRPGPVHINLPFREPLLPEPPISPVPAPGKALPLARSRLIPTALQLERIGRLIRGTPGLIICGPGEFGPEFPQQITALARALNSPILTDPLSGLRFGPHDKTAVISRYDAFLRPPGCSRLPEPTWLLRFGAPPVSKTLQQYMSARHCPLVLIAPHGDWPDPLHQTHEMVRADAGEFCQALSALKLTAPAPETLLEEFRKADERAGHYPADENHDLQPFEGNLIPELISTLPANATLFSGNSLPIRQLDSWSGTGHRPLRILANRGASGIDGNVSTLLGLAAAGTGPVAGLLGDLAFYHDMNGLLAGDGLDAVIIVLNNGGGGIFEYLPQGTLDGFEHHWLTPTDLDFEHTARLYGLSFQRVRHQPDFKPALTRALTEPGVSLVEVMIDRTHSLARHRAYWAAVAADFTGG